MTHKKVLLIKQISQEFALLVKLFCTSFFWKVFKKLPQLFFAYYIRKFQFQSWTKKFFINDLFSQQGAYLVKNPHFCSVLAHILCVNYKKLLTKISRSASQNYGARSSDRPKCKSASEPCGSIWVAENANFGWNS